MEQKKVYDLKEKTALYAERIRGFCVKPPKNQANTEYIPEYIRTSSLPVAHNIEANESPGDKDFKMKIRTCRKEAKEFFLIFTSILKKRGKDE
jgi:hypothetical protein